MKGTTSLGLECAKGHHHSYGKHPRMGKSLRMLANQEATAALNILSQGIDKERAINAHQRARALAAKYRKAQTLSLTMSTS